MRGKKSQKGSALLLVMTIVAVVATLSLSIIQLAIMTSRAVLRTEDSINAYLVATSALEDGLLRWKFDRNIEAPVPSASCNVPHATSDLFDRVNLTTGNVVSCDSAEQMVSAANEMAYDIKVFHRLAPGLRECVGNVDVGVAGVLPEDNCINPNGVALAQDQTAEYSIKDNSGVINLSWKFGDRGSSSQILLEIVSLGDNCDAVSGDRVCSRQAIRLNNNMPQYCNADTRTCNNVPIPAGGDTFRIKPFGTSLDYYVVSTSDRQASLDTRFTQMDITGYFGGVKRGLRLSLDRLTGQALPIYDFALFSAGSGLTVDNE